MTRNLPERANHAISYKDILDNISSISVLSDQSLDDISEAGGVCRSKCCQLFKQFVRLTPNTYLTRCRLTKSRRLLSNTYLSIAEIAEACGFQSSTYFATLFKHDFGETPIHYRESFKNNID